MATRTTPAAAPLLARARALDAGELSGIKWLGDLRDDERQRAVADLKAAGKSLGAALAQMLADGRGLAEACQALAAVYGANVHAMLAAMSGLDVEPGAAIDVCRAAPFTVQRRYCVCVCVV